jgi:hypothetical protein
MDTEEALAAIRQRESGNQNIPNQQGPGGAPASTASGYYQIIDGTWREGARLAGIDVGQYPRAIAAPFDVQHQVAQVLYARYGAKPWAASEPGARFGLASLPTPPVPPQGAVGGNLPMGPPPTQVASGPMLPPPSAMTSGMPGQPTSLADAFAQAAQRASDQQRKNAGLA